MGGAAEKQKRGGFGRARAINRKLLAEFKKGGDASAQWNELFLSTNGPHPSRMDSLEGCAKFSAKMKKTGKGNLWERATYGPLRKNNISDRSPT
jgi:hypothetical protein